MLQQLLQPAVKAVGQSTEGLVYIKFSLATRALVLSGAHSGAASTQLSGPWLTLTTGYNSNILCLTFVAFSFHEKHNLNTFTNTKIQIHLII